jgi:diguanylate cyclase (GGDEF)-like protein
MILIDVSHDKRHCCHTFIPRRAGMALDLDFPIIYSYAVPIHGSEKPPMKLSEIEEILDRTQGHLILRWNARSGSDTNASIGLTSIYCLVMLVILAAFCIESFTRGQFHHALVLGIFAALTISCYLYLRSTGRSRKTNSLIVLLLGLFCLFQLYTGGIGNTGPLWYYIFPLFAMFVQRLWAGILSVTILFIVTVILLLLPVAGFDSAVYTTAFKIQFLSVYLVVFIMAFFYAFVRTGAELSMDYANKNLKSLADTDELTKMANRRRMQEVLYQEVGRARRNMGTFCLIMLDLDDFKKLNDDYGHDCGDSALLAASNIIHDVLRTHDICSRWGGEEFLILLPGTDLAGAILVAERLREKFEAFRFQFGELELSFTASLGVSKFNRFDELADCLKTADKNMYSAKASGRNRVVAT